MAGEAEADAARAFRRAGRSREASAAAQRSRQLVKQCEGALTPALALVEEASPLTKREREVALLASQGLPSKDIAEKLFLSVRTVENHLQRAYEKLGVSGRDELARVLAS
jgi:DNA-binding CsgD family transcriptional regulator